MTSRRGFLSAVLALPVMGRLFGREQPQDWTVRMPKGMGARALRRDMLVEFDAPVRTRPIEWFRENYPS